jgi:squalene-hopene/tetraprenyl-beta-curcumene cyclase
MKKLSPMTSSVGVLEAETTWQTSFVDAQLPAIVHPVVRSREHLLSLEAPDGYWKVLFEMDIRQTAEYIFLKHLVGTRDTEEERRMLNHIVQMERPGGGWSNYYGGTPDLSTTVSAYYALRMGGLSPEHPILERARAVILSQGGIMQANCFTRSYLQLLGQMDADSLPAMPVEIVLLPKWFPFNLYALSSWTRAIMVPLLMVAALRKEKPAIPGPTCEELYPDGCDRKKLPIPRTKNLFTWHNFFLLSNRILKFYEKHPISWLRKQALEKAHIWIASHMGRPGGTAALFPSMVNSCIALSYLGYDVSHPLIARELHSLEELKVEEGDKSWMQPCFSTIWDTAWCLKILPELGLSPSHPSLVQAKDFLLQKQVGDAGDWQEKIPPVPCGGWYFEMENSLYPDVDDTAAVLMALWPYREEAKVKAAVERAIRWIFAMQCKDGGWASFDYQGKVYDCFNYIPFADHGALLDPPTADVTGRVVEALSLWGYRISDPNIQRAVKWLLKDQKPDGSWYGRWGVNYVYGTWAVLCGLKETGFDMKKESVRKAVRWLLDHQRHDGGWGESCASYPHPSQKGQGDSTASQTAWALMGLDSAGEYYNPAVRRGVKYLTQTQQPDGSWKEEFFTGTGFPGVCYLRYHLYSDHFPALALARLLPKLS